MAEVTVLMDGLPARCHRGFLGWSAVVLVRSEDRNILFDTGGYGDRPGLRAALEGCGLPLSAITDVVLSHIHFDHSVNHALFPGARVWVHAAEGDSGRQVPSDIAECTPEGMWASILHRAGGQVVQEGAAITSTVRLQPTPGHTPGSMSLWVDTPDGTAVLTGDAVKNAAEFIRGQAEMAFDARLWEASRALVRRTADIVYPGHDRPFKVKNGDFAGYLSSARGTVFLRADPWSDDWVRFDLSVGKLT